MTELTAEQIRQLAAIMDARFEREIAEIRAVTMRSGGEREAERLAGYPGGSDAVAIATVSASDDAVVRQNTQDVRDIIAARERINDGTYGTCVDCGAPIAYARLRAYPTAKRCIDCQRLHEAARTARTARHAP